MLDNFWHKKEKPLQGLWGMGYVGSIGAHGGADSPTSYIEGTGGYVSAGVATDGYTYHTFMSPGTFTWTGGNSESNLEFLIVGGGGGGADLRTGGGGGAGQVLQNILYPIGAADGSPGDKTISIGIGTGGTKVTGAPDVAGGTGADSTFTFVANSPGPISAPAVITAKGGGYGGFEPGYEDGGAGAGYGGKRSNSPTTQTWPSPNFGTPTSTPYASAVNDPGDDTPATGTYPDSGIGTDQAYGKFSWASAPGASQYGGSGGGGNIGIGQRGGFAGVPVKSELLTAPFWTKSPTHPSPSGDAGWVDCSVSAGANPPTAGSASSWWGTGAGGDGIRLNTYRLGMLLPPTHPNYTHLEKMSGWYGGGGGGGRCSPYDDDFVNASPGGKGGGACGSIDGNSITVPGLDGTGGGGGGSGGGTGGASPGGDGICIIRYKNDDVITGGQKWTDGTYTYHSFTENGVFEVPATSPRVGQPSEWILVGGGGGGGAYNAGGGGSGRSYHFPGITLAAGKCGVVIGQGGQGSTTWHPDYITDPYAPYLPYSNVTKRWNRGVTAGAGQPSFLIGGKPMGMATNNEDVGGGGWGGNNWPMRDGGEGGGPPTRQGSGGGASDSGSGGNGDNNGGNAGGPGCGGGGGGTGSAGDAGPSPVNAGNGGTGVDHGGVLPTTIPYMLGFSTPTGRGHAGGGGGGGRPTGGAGAGEMGGGNGSYVASPSTTGYDAMAFDAIYATGSGGGGGAGGPLAGSNGSTALAHGGNGGPGVFIVRYPT